jgi:hypothetical protein
MYCCRIGLFCVFLFAVSCSLTLGGPLPKPADVIIGKWQGDGSTFTVKGKEKDKVYVRKAEIEFRKDGTFTFSETDLPELKEISPESVKGHRATGKYSRVTETEIEVVLKLDGEEVKRRAKVEVTKDELILTPMGEGEKPMKYKRVKE